MSTERLVEVAPDTTWLESEPYAEIAQTRYGWTATLHPGGIGAYINAPRRWRRTRDAAEQAGRRLVARELRKREFPRVVGRVS